MRFRLAVLLAAMAMACGSIQPSPAGTPSPSPGGTPLSQAQLKFHVLDAAGKPAYCDPDYYPVGSPEREQANAIANYPAIKADAETYAAILAHEGLPSGDLSDQQKLTLYRAWKLLRALVLTADGSNFSFQYRVLATPNGYQMVSGTVTSSGAVQVASRTQAGPPICPICLAASTLIATPSGPMRVTDLHVGSIVWTASATGARVAEPVIEVGSTAVPPEHLMVDLVLADGRELLASPGHRTADGRALGALRAGDSLDGSTITRWELVAYAGERTYDLLPAGATGRYWANGILLSSTLSA